MKNFKLLAKERMRWIETGLVFAADLTLSEWKAECWPEAVRRSKSSNFQIGDAINKGVELAVAEEEARLGASSNLPENRVSERAVAYGQKYMAARASLSVPIEDLRTVAWVCASVPLSLRSDNLSWHHHRLVAPLSHDQQRNFLDLAEREGWSVADLREAIAQSREDPGENEPAEIGGISASISLAYMRHVSRNGRFR